MGSRVSSTRLEPESSEDGCWDVCLQASIYGS